MANLEILTPGKKYRITQQWTEDGETDIVYGVFEKFEMGMFYFRSDEDGLVPLYPDEILDIRSDILVRCTWCEKKGQIVIEKEDFSVGVFVEKSPNRSVMKVYNGNNLFGSIPIEYCPRCGRAI